MDVRDRNVVVTGSGHGIGQALAARFAKAGARSVVVSDIDGDRTRLVGEELGQPFRQLDVADADALDAFIDWVEHDVGPIDLFCNNPAIFGGPEGTNLQTSEETWERSWQVNVMSHIRSATKLVPLMLERGGGYFLQTISAAGLITSNSAAAYTVTKHAGIGFAEWLMLNYGDRNIRVSCLCPTAVETSPGQFANMPEIGLVQSAAEVADVALEGVEAETFLILPNPAVGGSFRKKATDYDAWLARSIKRISPIKPRGPWDDRFPPPPPESS